MRPLKAPDQTNNIGQQSHNLPKDRIAFWAIFLVPILWGIGFPVTHNAVKLIDPGLYVFLRAAVAIVVMLPFVWSSLRQSSRRIVLGGFLLGMTSAINSVGQAYALQYLPSATVAFLVTLNIVFVPFVIMAMGQGKPSRIDLLSIAIGVLGAYVILGPVFGQLSMGYVWGLINALFIAIAIGIVGTLSPGMTRSERLSLSFYQVLFTLLLLLYFPFSRDWSPVSTFPVWSAIIYMGMFSSAAAILLQVTFQQRVGNTRTAVIFNLDLVFASLFGLINREQLSPTQIIGGSIIFLASMIEPLIRLWQKQQYLQPTKKNRKNQ